jgi:hypothetical protein
MRFEAHTTGELHLTPTLSTDVPLEELYRTSTILEGLATLPPASVFLRDKLFSKVQTSPTDLVSIEFYKGRQKLAPFCSRFSKGIAVAREKTQLSLFSPPFIKPVRMRTADDTFYRSMGQAAGGGNATNRDAELLALDSTELDADISRREEWMCAEASFKGKVVCLDGDTGKLVSEIDYGPISRTVTPNRQALSEDASFSSINEAPPTCSEACRCGNPGD